MSAIISADGIYRYRLERQWDRFWTGRVCFIMLNPSTADAERDDATVRRCIGFAKRWGFGGLTIVNLYAYRSTAPGKLWSLPEDVAIGEFNRSYVYNALDRCDRAIAAWGAYAPPARMADLIRGHRRNLEAFQPLTKDGWPRHPVRLAYSTPTDAYHIPQSAKPSIIR